MKDIIPLRRFIGIIEHVQAQDWPRFRDNLFSEWKVCDHGAMRRDKEHVCEEYGKPSQCPRCFDLAPLIYRVETVHMRLDVCCRCGREAQKLGDLIVSELEVL